MTQGVIGLRWPIFVVLLVPLLLIPGCQLNLPGTAVSHSRARDTGTISRSFGHSSSYDTKIFRVKQASEYEFDVAVEIERGTAVISLEEAQNTYFMLAGDLIRERLAVELEPGDYLIVIETFDAFDGQITIEYNNVGSRHR